jgi:hypothetical protein
MMTRRLFLKTAPAVAATVAIASTLSEVSQAQTAESRPAFRSPKKIVPITSDLKYQQAIAGAPDTQLTREATGLLHEYSTPLLINHSHRVYFWANELGRQSGQKYDQELLFICAAFHDLGLLKSHRTADDRFEVDSANTVRQFLEHHNVPAARIQVAWDSIALHTTPGIAAYKAIEVELIYNGVGVDSLGINYQAIPEDLRKKVVTQFPRVNFHQEIAKAFFDGVGYRPKTTEGTCNEDLCSHFIRNYKHSNFYDQVINSPFENS